MWIETCLLPRLEESRSGPQVKLFLMDRDSNPGYFHLETVRSAIHHCKSTLIIISENFTSHPWICHAIREAECFSLLNSQHRVRIVLFGISANEAASQDELVEEYIACNKALKADHWNFWRELFYFVPYRSIRSNLAVQRDPNNIELDNMGESILSRD